jgi:hypothetical protein
MSPEIIAQRVYVIAGSPEIEVRVDLHRPIPDGNDYRCDYAIAWPENPRRGYAIGVDSLQALYLGLQKIAIDLDASEPARSGRLTWLGDARNFGLPFLPPMR